MIKLCIALLVSITLPISALEKLGTTFNFNMPEYMASQFEAIESDEVHKRWLWIHDEKAVEFMYIHEEKSPYNYDEALIGERYLSTLSLEDFAEAYGKKAFPAIKSLDMEREFLDQQKNRMIVHWSPPDYGIPVQRLSLFQRGQFGGIFIFSFVANHTKVSESKLEGWRKALKMSRISYVMK